MSENTLNVLCKTGAVLYGAATFATEVVVDKAIRNAVGDSLPKPLTTFATTMIDSAVAVSGAVGAAYIWNIPKLMSLFSYSE